MHLNKRLSSYLEMNSRNSKNVNISFRKSHQISANNEQSTEYCENHLTIKSFVKASKILSNFYNKRNKFMLSVKF